MANREDTIREKIGPWRREDYDSFLALDVALQPSPQNRFVQLSGADWSRETAGAERWDREYVRLVDEAWKVRRTHPVHKALAKDPNFRAAWSVFEKRQKAAMDGKLISPTTPFVFLQQFVEWAGVAYQMRGRSESSKSGAHAKRRKAAIEHANKLQRLLAAGVSLDDYSDTQRLRELLRKLNNELSNMRRKKYGGKRAVERSILKGLALLMLVRCGLKSPTVVMRFADVVGLRCDEKKAKRYCDEAAKRISDMGREHPDKNRHECG